MGVCSDSDWVNEEDYGCDHCARVFHKWEVNIIAKVFVFFFKERLKKLVLVKWQVSGQKVVSQTVKVLTWG